MQSSLATTHSPHPVSLPRGIFYRECALGMGAFAARDFAPGERIARFRGRFVGPEIALNVPAERMGDPLQVGETRYLILDEPYRLFNHSCCPNAGLTPELDLVALEPIPAGRQIFYDYSTTMGDANWSIPCRCDAPGCRGAITDFVELPAEVRSRYVALGVVQPFLLGITGKN